MYHNCVVASKDDPCDDWTRDLNKLNKPIDKPKKRAQVEVKLNKGENK